MQINTNKLTLRPTLFTNLLGNFISLHVSAMKAIICLDLALYILVSTFITLWVSSNTNLFLELSLFDYTQLILMGYQSIEVMGIGLATALKKKGFNTMVSATRAITDATFVGIGTSTEFQKGVIYTAVMGAALSAGYNFTTDCKSWIYAYTDAYQIYEIMTKSPASAQALIERLQVAPLSEYNEGVALEVFKGVNRLKKWTVGHYYQTITLQEARLIVRFALDINKPELGTMILDSTGRP